VIFDFDFKIVTALCGAQRRCWSRLWSQR